MLRQDKILPLDVEDYGLTSPGDLSLVRDFVLVDDDALVVDVGSAVPDCAWTKAMSELLIAPFTVTSSRKLFCVTGCPDADCV